MLIREATSSDLPAIAVLLEELADALDEEEGIDELIVRKEYQRRGTGRKLVAAAIETCRELGCCEAEVSTEKTNRKALQFYRKCGFEERGVLLEADL